MEVQPMTPSRDQKILVAEDSEINQMIISRQLELCGFRADVADNGRLAFERWENGNYAVLLCDLQMPVMDGYALTEAIRASEQGLRHLPILAWTANATTDEKANRWRAAGMDDCLSKPTQLVELKAKLERWMPDSAPSATAAEPTVVSKAESAPVDINVLKTMIGDDEATIRRFLREFPIEAAKTAAEMRSAYTAGQMAVIGELAHGLKSSAFVVGAMALGELCAEMESAGKLGDSGALAALLPRFEQEMTRVEDYLERYPKPAWKVPLISAAS